MAENSSIENASSCPMAQLAAEAHRLVVAHAAVDQANIAGLIDQDRSGLLQSTLLDALDTIAQRATWLEPQSPRGAIFALAILSDRVEKIGNSEDQEIVRAIFRVIDGLRAYLEGNSPDDSLDDECRAFWLRPRAELALIGEAMALTALSVAAE